MHSPRPACAGSPGGSSNARSRATSCSHVAAPRRGQCPEFSLQAAAAASVVPSACGLRAMHLPAARRRGSSWQESGTSPDLGQRRRPNLRHSRRRRAGSSRRPQRPRRAGASGGAGGRILRRTRRLGTQRRRRDRGHIAQDQAGRLGDGVRGQLSRVLPAGHRRASGAARVEGSAVRDWFEPPRKWCSRF